MRLSKPGLYVSRDGRVAMSYHERSRNLLFAIRDARDTQSLTFVFAGDPSTEGEWQRIDLDAVKWPPELPPKPPQVYALEPNRVTDEGIKFYSDAPCKPRWWTVYGTTAWSGGLCFGIQQLTVVENERNDREAVAMIEAARKEVNDAN